MTFPEPLSFCGNNNPSSARSVEKRPITEGTENSPTSPCKRLRLSLRTRERPPVNHDMGDEELTIGEGDTRKGENAGRPEHAPHSSATTQPMAAWQVLDQALLHLHVAISAGSHTIVDEDTLANATLEGLTRGAALQPEDVTNEEWSIGLRDVAEAIMTGFAKSLESAKSGPATTPFPELGRGLKSVVQVSLIPADQIILTCDSNDIFGTVPPKAYLGVCARDGRTGAGCAEVTPIPVYRAANASDPSAQSSRGLAGVPRRQVAPCEAFGCAAPSTSDEEGPAQVKWPPNIAWVRDRFRELRTNVRP